MRHTRQIRSSFKICDRTDHILIHDVWSYRSDPHLWSIILQIRSSFIISGRTNQILIHHLSVYFRADNIGQKKYLAALQRQLSILCKCRPHTWHVYKKIIKQTFIHYLSFGEHLHKTSRTRQIRSSHMICVLQVKTHPWSIRSDIILAGVEPSYLNMYLSYNVPLRDVDGLKFRRCRKLHKGNTGKFYDL